MARRRLIETTKKKQEKKCFTFVIPASWIMSGEVEVQASSLEKAIEIANEASFEEYHAEFVGDSFEINEDVESYDVNKQAIELCKIEATNKIDLPLLIGSLKYPVAQKYLEEKIKGV